MPVLEQAGTESESAPIPSAPVVGRRSGGSRCRPSGGGCSTASPHLRPGLGEFGAVLVVSGSVSGLTETATLYIYRALDERNPIGAHAIAVVLALFSFILLLAMEFFRKKRRRRN